MNRELHREIVCREQKKKRLTRYWRSCRFEKWWSWNHKYQRVRKRLRGRARRSQDRQTEHILARAVPEEVKT